MCSSFFLVVFDVSPLLCLFGEGCLLMVCLFRSMGVCVLCLKSVVCVVSLRVALLFFCCCCCVLVLFVVAYVVYVVSLLLFFVSVPISLFVLVVCFCVFLL